VNWKVWLALSIGVVVGFGVCVCAQELVEAKRRSWAKRSAAECLVLSDALEKYRADHGHYPPLDGDLTPYLTPQYLQWVPKQDTHAQPLVIALRGNRAAVIAIGAYGAMAEGGAVVRPKSY